MGLLEILVILAVIIAIAGGIAIHPLMFVILLVAVALFFTRGGLGHSV